MGMYLTICGIDFELKLNRMFASDYLQDIVKYIPAYEKNNTCNYKVKLSYLINDEIYKKIYAHIKNSSYNERILIYKSNTKIKHGYKYYFENYQMIVCQEEPYIVILKKDETICITTSLNKNKIRLFSRIILEMLFRIKYLQGFKLIHAACVEINGKGVLICGEKHRGKTTLLLHLLASGKGKLVSNDKVFLNKETNEVQFVPLVVRVGQGTVNNFKQIDLNGSFVRISDSEKQHEKPLFGNDKWEMTPHELVGIFGTEYIDTTTFDYLISAHINEEKLCMVEDYVDVLQFDLWNLEKFKVPNWILNEYAQRQLKSQEKICEIKKPLQYKSYQLAFKYISRTNDIIKEIDRYIV